MIKLCQMPVCNEEVANLITSKADGAKTNFRGDGKVEISFPFIDKYVKNVEGFIEQVGYILENGIFALVVEDKQVITGISFLESKDVLKIVYNK